MNRTTPAGRIVVAAVTGTWEVRDGDDVLYWGPLLKRALSEARMHAARLGSDEIVVLDPGAELAQSDSRG